MAGDDTITGNGNTRIAFYNATAGVTVDLAAGTATGDASVGSDIITVGIIGGVNGGVNSIVGSQFVDILFGSANAANTSEQFEGRAGNDTFDGRGGFAQAVYGNDTAVTSGIAVDMLAGTVTGDAAIGTDTLIGIESVRGTNFVDTYVATDFGGFNDFEGLGGNDTITGNGATRIGFNSATAGVTVDLAAGTATGNASVGADNFSGVSRARDSNFNDTLLGDGADNILEGVNGIDRLDGGLGTDTLIGGLGNDRFVFQAPNEGLDTITDFQAGDRLEISAAGFGGGLVAGETVTLVIAGDIGSANGGAAGYFIFDDLAPDQSTVYWDATGGSGDDAIAIAMLTGVTTLAQNDFLVV
jgi:Ca2+-binding RTX toxin-like protein